MSNPRATTKQRALPYLCTAAGMVVILGVVYALCGYWPLGPNSVMTGDLNSQYIPFYAHFYEALHSGTGSLTYAGDMGLGGRQLCPVRLLLCQPLRLAVSPLCPRDLRLALLCGLGPEGAAGRFDLCVVSAAALGGLPLFVPLGWCYALMGYTVAYAQNVLWLDSVILLPLVAAGLDGLLAGKRGLGFALALAGAIFANFYMGYMLCIFSVLYILVQLAARPLEEGRKVLPLLGRFAVCGSTGAALAGVVLGPRRHRDSDRKEHVPGPHRRGAVQPAGPFTEVLHRQLCVGGRTDRPAPCLLRHAGAGGAAALSGQPPALAGEGRLSGVGSPAGAEHVVAAAGPCMARFCRPQLVPLPGKFPAGVLAADPGGRGRWWPHSHAAGCSLRAGWPW